MATSAPGDEFVTIVPVGESHPAATAAAATAASGDSATFVTVLTLGAAAAGAAEVVVRRPRGARLGLGLKFEGGSAAAETVRRLLVQSCTEDSPAANADAPWGKLIPGDEILAIDGVSVSELTRIDCVRRLKDSDEALTLLVRHFATAEDNETKSIDVTDCATNAKLTTEIMRPKTHPPPVPPRKLGKKNSFKDKTFLQSVGEQNCAFNTELHKQMLVDKESAINGHINGLSAAISNKLSRKSSFDSHLHRQSKESIASLKRGSPEEVRRLVRRLSDGKSMPPEAEVYIDLLSTEWERCLTRADAESDDTGSSISTVVDRLGSMAGSVENSIPSTPIMQPKTIDIHKVLNCIENIDYDILKDINNATILEKQTEVQETKTDFKVKEKTCSINAIENTSTSSAHEETTTNNKQLIPNDKNNNNMPINVACINLDANDQRQTVTVDTKVEKPKPMPRITKLERSVSEKKPKPIPTPKTAPADTLLTPTKKNCIESWLQRSEAEMGSKSAEEDSPPEALPRLIDFVPKPQFKECEAPTPLARPTAPPPPPPPLVDAREDGSGASLDTIGELDETNEAVDNRKAVAPEKETKERKASYESGFWEDRVNKSDAEDKSLSNDEALPTCPRQPPDGVETPADAVEKVADQIGRLPPRLPSGWPTARTRLSYTSRSQDARSEASVKDKIAMFQTDTSSSSDVLDKCGTLPARSSCSSRKTSTSSYPSTFEVTSLDRRLTKSQDNLDEVPCSYKRHSERPEVLGALESNTIANFTAVNAHKPLQIENKPLFYGSTTTLQPFADSSFTRPVFHSRSSSDDNGSSVHKSNLEYLIEQRKKSMSKLRGLVIPEAQQGPIVDLPAIKVQDPLTKTFLLQSNQNQSHYTEPRPQKKNTSKVLNITDKKWKTELLANNIPKYSPAFKRKSLQVYSPTSLSKESTPERKLYDRDLVNKIINNRMVPSKPPRTSLDIKSMSEMTTSTLPSKFALSNSTRLGNKDLINDLRNYKNVEIKICTATDIVDSDNDSAMSSTQSSYRSSASSPLHTLDSIESDSSRLSPRICHLTSYSLVKTEIPTKSSGVEKSCEEYVKRSVCRSVSSDTNVSLSSSAGSAATSGSQASCSSLESSVADSDKKKIGKPYNIDTINRRNILASAKCRSGRDAKLNSPVIEAKFSHESSDRSPSPQLKSSDRLSTLTSTVSAIANKGENRRRNKVIAETDSDSDEEVNVRQRKTDFKTTRLKKNSSASNKNKPIETFVENIKVEEAPKAISDRIIQEIKKAGLDNYNTIKTKAVTEKNNVQSTRIEAAISKKEEKVVKVLTNIPKPKTDMSKNCVSDVAKVSEKPKSVVDSTKTIVANGKVKLNVVADSKSTETIRLKRGVGTGVGVILAGGTDCEAKEVTVHRVLADSVADRAGLKRGARIRSINGHLMAGMTHAQSVAILKDQRSEVVIEIENETRQNGRSLGCGSNNAETKARQEAAANVPGKLGSRTVVTVMLEKAGGGAGLGFGLDGGRDSPQGDRPLTVKKLFAGGAASRSGRILVGAELLSAGGQSMEAYTRTQAWAALKALPAGPVALVLRNPEES